MHLRYKTKPTRCHAGIVHNYADGLAAFEYTKSGQTKPHSLFVIGGLGDGLCTVEYAADIAAALETTDWSVFSLVLSSSYNGWGVGRLAQDIDEIAQCIRYLQQDYKAPSHGTSARKIVIMGHSTGSQDVMQYISSPNPRPLHPILDRGILPSPRPQVDGAIIQAPVSDREGFLWALQEGSDRHSPSEMQQIYDDAVAYARKRMFEGEDSLDVILPLSVTTSFGFPSSTPVSSRRFLSLASPDSPGNPSEDDLFSSDLSEEQLQKTFGMIGPRGVLVSQLLVLYSGQDQYVPPWVDKEALLSRWEKATDSRRRPLWHRESGIIPGATHGLSDHDQTEPRRVLVEKVTRYLNDVQLRP